MTNEKIKETLLSVEDCEIEFSVTQSGKKSRKVNGLYKPEAREIIIHNKNFEKDGKVDENILLYTALHEYAHHKHSCARGGNLPSRAHTEEFWAIFHGLLEKAEAKGIYVNMAAQSEELAEITRTIREDYIKKSGEILKQFGELLKKAYTICEREGLRFEDYIDRVLRLPRSSANLALKVQSLDLDNGTGADNMKFFAGIRKEDVRRGAEKELLAGKSPSIVKAAARQGLVPAVSAKERLLSEKNRLERTIQTLSKRLTEVEHELAAADGATA